MSEQEKSNEEKASSKAVVTDENNSFKFFGLRKALKTASLAKHQQSKTDTEKPAEKREMNKK
jgi:hypothetical protein